MRWDIRNQYARLRQRLRRFRKVKVWQLLVVLLLGVIVTAIGFRLNNLGLGERIDAVTAADKSAEPEAINQTVYELRRYVSTHMNTNLNGGMFLHASYNREVERISEEMQKTAEAGGGAAAQASIECRARWHGGVASFREDYIGCVRERTEAAGEGAANTGLDELSSLELPDPNLYKVNSISPLWSPDLAGFGLLFCVIIVVIIIARITGVVALRLLLKRHFSKV